MKPKEKILSIFELIANKQELALKGSVISIDIKEDVDDDITHDQLKNILTILEKEYKAIVIKSIPDYKKNFSYTLSLSDDFEAIYDEVYSQAHFGINNLDDIALLKVIDVAFDINDKLKLTRGNVVQFYFFQQPIRFIQLFPINTASMRNQYMDYRWAGCTFLKEIGAINHFKNLEGMYEMDSTIEATVNRRKFDSVLRELQDKFREYNKKSSKPNPISKMQASAKPLREDEIVYDDEHGIVTYRQQSNKCFKTNTIEGYLFYRVHKADGARLKSTELANSFMDKYPEQDRLIKNKSLTNAKIRANNTLKDAFKIEKVIEYENNEFWLNHSYCSSTSPYLVATSSK